MVEELALWKTSIVQSYVAADTGPAGGRYALFLSNRKAPEIAGKMMHRHQPPRWECKSIDENAL